MVGNKKARSVVFTAMVIVLSLIGAVYCMYQLQEAKVAGSCLTSGCNVFQDFTVFGVSLWLWGFVYFSSLVCFSVMRANGLVYGLVLLGVFIEVLLLSLMLLVAPCTNCLGVSLIVFILALAGHLTGISSEGFSVLKGYRKISIPLMSCMGILFFAVIMVGASEVLGVWVLSGEPTDLRRVYFSPSCKACKKSVKFFDGKAAFVPVLENESDFKMVLGMKYKLDEGESITKALEYVESVYEGKGGGATKELKQIEPHFIKMAYYKFRLLINKGDVHSLGFKQLPLIMINGMP